jgi:hypothetical protein
MKPKSLVKPLRVRVSFVGEAAMLIRSLHTRGMHGPTLELVVEGLALAELRRIIAADPASLRRALGETALSASQKD